MGKERTGAGRARWRAPSRPRRSGAAGTRSRILEVAEKLIAKQGIEGLSLRALTARAGVNLAAINYHFGGKENLINEVFARFLLPLEEERTRLLGESEAQARQGADGVRALRVEDLVRAYLLPWFGFKERYPGLVESAWAFYRRSHGTSILFRDLVQRAAKRAYADFTESVFRALPNAPREELLARIHLAIVTGAAFVTNDWLTRTLEDLSGTRIEEARLVRYLVSVIEAGAVSGARAPSMSIHGAAHPPSERRRRSTTRGSRLP